ncbi:uncharacterized protein [Rutidosis leptorrhynchoides]|uniref:uncharacterized protein n=1 Tax=Rutidosis leptorrhynchoides TaxID=125765 RepID=UPI003A99B30E
MTQIKAQRESLIDFEDYPGDSFIDSLLNFDDWVEHNPILPSSPIFEKMSNISEKEEIFGSEKQAEDLGCCSLIQEEMGKVSLIVAGDDVDVTSGGESNIKSDDLKLQDVSVDGGVNNEHVIVQDGAQISLKNDENDVVKDGGNTSAEESSSSSSESSSSDDDDSDDDEKGKKVIDEDEMEEGEIAEEVVAAWSDDEDGADVVKGPIRSKNEVQDLPPVPPVNVTIQPHHQTLPVGAVLSIMGTQVIVEGVDNHNPLSEGSILWITESRSPLGVVDEIFGPVKNPYYIVRYNSESEIPTGIEQGSAVSFVPEFADYVLNNNNSLYKKGYDASGENDEELSEELEFSDDEKEAEYKKMIKMSKRNSSDQKNGNRKKDKKSRNRGGNWKYDQQPSCNSQVNGSTSGPQAFSPSQVNSSQQAFSPSQVNGSSVGPTSGPQAFSPSQVHSLQQAFSPSQVNGPSVGPTSGPQAFSPGPQAPNFTGPPSGVWPNGFSPMQPQNIGFLPNGFPSNVPFMQRNFAQQPFQNIGLTNLGPFPPQFNSNAPMFPCNNFVQGGVPPNFGANHPFVPQSWPVGMPQNNFNPSQIGPPMVFQGPPQGVALPNGLQMENTGAMRPPFVSGTAEASENSNQGNGFPNRGGRKPFQRGGGRFRGGRGGRSRTQSK